MVKQYPILVTNVKDHQQLLSKPSFASQMIFNGNLVAVHEIKEVLTLNKPSYMNMCILDLSKTLM